MNRSQFIRSAAFGSVLTFLPKRMPPVDELAAIWQVSGELTLEYADAMPAADYSFRPADLQDIFSYGGQFQHIAENINGIISNHVTELPPPDITLKQKDFKPGIRKNLELVFEYGATAIRELARNKWTEEVEFFARPLPRWHAIFIAQDHTTHHCGQAVVYLNAMGINPPNYRKW